MHKFVGVLDKYAEIGGNAGLCQPRIVPWNLCSRQDACHLSCVRTPLRSAMSDARLSSLSEIQVHKHNQIDLNEVISEFAGKKDRRLAMSL